MAGHVHEVTDATFDGTVLERSSTIPVLVDFWAPWCGPCRVLAPVLERLAPELAGSVEICKLETDANPATAARYRISSIPAVKLFVGGQVAGEFLGALPEAQVRAFLDAHLPDEHATAVQAAVARLQPGGGGLDQPARADAAAHARAVPARSPQWDLAQALLAVLELAAQPAEDSAPGRAFHGALDALLAGEATAALDALLEVVAAHRRWRDDAGRRAIITVFTLLGVRSPTSDAYRRKLAALI